MNKKSSIVILLLLTIMVSAYGEVYLRYNYLGYNPARQKRIIIMSENALKGQEWKITKDNKTIKKGTFGAKLYGKGGHTPMPYNYVVNFSEIRDEGNYYFETKGSEKGKLIIKKNPYGWILEKPIRWMRAARCGSKDCIDHEPCHFGDKACRTQERVKGSNKNWVNTKDERYLEMVGGWHDAGDYMKFTLTISYATYFILRAYEVNPDIFTKKYSKTDLVDVLDEGKWGLEWLMKTMPDDTTFVIQVADYEDHNVGQRLPHKDHLDGKRPALLALSPTQMGYTAASLALGARIFRKLGKTADADRYIKKAQQIFRVATSDKALKYPAWYIANHAFYNDNTKHDNLQLAAGELYQYTKDQKYLDAAKKISAKTLNSGWRAWESVNMHAHMSIMKDYSVVKIDLKKDLDTFSKNSKKKGNIWGLPLKYVWGGLYSYIGIGSAAMEYQERTGDKTYEFMARQMLDYLMGTNNWGICFIATKELDNTIKYPFSQIYTLQEHLFPEGAISEGPGDTPSWEHDKRWFGYDHTVLPQYKFNTEKGTFYDHKKDYMCMETTIGGMADGIFFLSLASKLYSD